MGIGGRPPELAAIRQLIDAGEALAAYDLAMSVTAPPVGSLDHSQLVYLRALALARSGATNRAAEELDSLNDTDAELPEDLSEDVAALAARLAKDHALTRVGDERRNALALAAGRYEAVAGRHNRPFAMVNAATLWFLAGDVGRSEQLATKVLDLLPVEPTTYWDLVTLAEAELVRGGIPQATAALEAAGEQSAGAGQRATTWRQLRLLCDERSLDAEEVLKPITNPSVLHYCGHMRLADVGAVTGEVGHWLDDHEFGDAYGALACGADIVIAEHLLARGARLHVVLPFAIDEFLDVSVRPGGPTWEARFHACLAAAHSVDITCDSPYFGDDALFAYCSDVAMGSAVTRARSLEARAMQLAVWDGSSTGQPAGTARDVAVWRNGGRHTHVVAATTSPAPDDVDASTTQALDRRVAVAVFGDFAGFSRLYDHQYAGFSQGVMTAVAEVVDRFDSVLQERNTWGDGLVFVLSDVAAAADLAVSLLERLADLDLATIGLPDDLRLRLSAHAGPVLDVHDPVRRRAAVSGRSLTRAARIEPRTPPGQVYVSGAFAALLALQPDQPVRSEYVGTLATAKGFETIPMHVLKRST